jgi:hypothetical protein
MHDEAAATMYESARHRLMELLSQEKEAKEQISHLAPFVEQLTRLCGRKPAFGHWQENRPLAIGS